MNKCGNINTIWINREYVPKSINAVKLIHDKLIDDIKLYIDFMQINDFKNCLIQNNEIKKWNRW